MIKELKINYSLKRIIEFFELNSFKDKEESISKFNKELNVKTSFLNLPSKKWVYDDWETDRMVIIKNPKEIISALMILPRIYKNKWFKIFNLYRRFSCTIIHEDGKQFEIFDCNYWKIINPKKNSYDWMKFSSKF